MECKEIRQVRPAHASPPQPRQHRPTVLRVLQQGERQLGSTDVEVDIAHEAVSGRQGAVSSVVLSTHPIDFGNSMRPMRVLSDCRKADSRQLPYMDPLSVCKHFD